MTSENRIEIKNEGTAGEERRFAGTRIWSVSNLLLFPETENAWIIRGLLRPDSQMLLAAPPKSGKSLLASELALALTVPFKDGETRYLFGAEPDSESKFPGLEICRPPESQTSWKVLFVSLEMREAEVAGRLRKQLRIFGHDELPSLTEKGPEPHELRFPLTHIFGLNRNGAAECNQDLQVVSIETGIDAVEIPPVTHGSARRGYDFGPFKELIMAAEPDVVIYDTLIQMHSVNENDNILMKEALRILRRLTVAKGGSDGTVGKPIAHIILHHTRKESGQFRSALSPEIMRGAGAVHGVADLVMLARPDLHRSDRLEIHISSRSSSIPNFFLQRQSDSLTHKCVPREKDDRDSGAVRLRKVILNLLKGSPGRGRKLSRESLDSAIKKEFEESGRMLRAGFETVQTRVDELLDGKSIHIVKVEQKMKANGKPRVGAVKRWPDCWFRVGEGKRVRTKVVKK